MSDFRAHIVGDLDLSEARSQMESFLNEYKDKKLKITPEINTSQAQKAGEQAAQAVSKGMEKSAQSTGAQFAQAVSKGASKSKKGKDLFGFSEEQQKVRKKIAKDAELLQESYPGLNKKDAKKDARGYYTAQESERKKAEQAAQKASEQKMKDSISAINEESKARERAEKQNYQARKKNADAIMKESLANIEKQSKNKADIIKAQASGKDSTVDILKEQRKQLRSEGRKLQKEMRSYNDIYSPSERSQILRNKRMESSYDVDMARATVSDKVAASLKVSSSGSASSSNSTKSGNNKIRYNVETGNYAARSSKMEKQLSVYSGQDTENVAKATIALKTYNEELGNLQNHFNGSKRMNGSELAASFERMTKAGDTFKNTLSQINDTQSKNLATGVAERGANKIAAYYEANSKAVKKYGASLKELESQYRNAKTVEDKGNIENEFSTLKSRISAEGLTGKSGLDEAKRAFKQIGQFAMTYGLIQNTVMQIPSQMISAVKDVDSSMTNLYKVTDETQSRYDQYQKSAAQSATSLGRSMSSYINQTAEWSKLGYSLDDSEKLSKLSSIYANVGEVSDDTAVSDMVTAMKAYNIKANNAQSIIDSLNILGNNYATSSADLGEGLSNSASSLAVSGNDINQSLAMLTGMAEITQSAPEAGNALKILSMRIRGYDEQTDSYTNDTEELSGAIADLTKTAKTPGGISLFTDDSKQTYKDTYTLMKDISEVYDDLSDKKKAELLEKLAGKNRGNQIAALIQGFQSGQVQKAYEDSINSEGSAQQEQDRWLNSIEAKQQQFQAAMQNLATSTISSDFFKGLTDTGTGALNVLTNIVDKFGLLNTAAVGLGIFQGKNNSGESTWESPHAFFETTYAA